MNKVEKYLLMERMSKLLSSGITFKQLHEKLLKEGTPPESLLEVCKKNEDFGSVSNVNKVLRATQEFRNEKMLMRSFVAIKCKGVSVDFRRICSIVETHAKSIDSEVPACDWTYKYSRDLLEKSWAEADSASKEIYGLSLINKWN